MPNVTKLDSHVAQSEPPRRFKIAFFLTDLGRHGVGRIMATLCNALAACGHDVTIILRDDGSHYAANLTSDVHKIVLNSRMRSALPKLIRLLRRERFDCVISGSDLPNTSMALVKPFIPRHTRAVFAEFNDPLAIDRAFLVDKLVGGAGWRLMRRLRPLLYRSADKIVILAENLRQPTLSTSGWAAEKVIAIPSPIDVETISRQAQEPADHPWVGDGGGPVFVACGRLDAQKDFSTLVLALAELRQRVPARLIILGEGPERVKLEHLIASLNLQEAVSLPGFTSHPFPLFARADAFVLSSLYEGLVTVVIEALACGTPVVATESATEILEGGKWGRVVPPSDPAALASAMEQTLDAPRQSDELKRRAAYYAPERAVERYLNLIEELSLNRG